MLPPAALVFLPLPMTDSLLLFGLLADSCSHPS